MWFVCLLGTYLVCDTIFAIKLTTVNICVDSVQYFAQSQHRYSKFAVWKDFVSIDGIMALCRLERPLYLVCWGTDKSLCMCSDIVNVGQT